MSSSRALDQVSKGSTDLIVVDLQDDSSDFVYKLRELTGWQKPTVMAVSPDDNAIRGADVVLRRPVTDRSVASSLKVAYSRMLFDHRRHVRYALMRTVSAMDDKGRIMDVTVRDIGDGGIGLSTKHQFSVGDTLSLRLLLPGTQRAIYIQARVRWTHDYGKAGCEFLRIPPVDLNILRDWLKSKNQIKKPVVEL
ncbi:MAG: PilZ domain-containing protein [Candidatus Sulfotelmatobacter sp.]